MADEFEFAPVAADRWADLARLFERRGGPKYCWCTVLARAAERAAR